MANGFYHESIADAELERQLRDAILIIGSMQSDFRILKHMLEDSDSDAPEAAKRILELRNAHGKTKQPLNQAKMNANEFNCDCVRISTKNVPNRDALAASLQRNPWDGGSYKAEIWPGLPVEIVQRRQVSSAQCVQGARLSHQFQGKPAMWNMFLRGMRALHPAQTLLII
ncbi:hypothetical protein E4U34_007389 [Claviceps purpurea]|nr:hypothetical protein E4U34_007389 [Claviceps purpurea]